MQRYSTTSLASRVCPSAPFLLPQALRIPLPAAWRISSASLHSSTPLQRSADQPQKLARHNVRHFKPAEPESDVSVLRSNLLRDFRDLLHETGVGAVINSYPSLLAQKILEPRDTRNLCTELHTWFRLHKKNSSQSSSREFQRIYAFVQQIVKDIRSRALPPHTWASLHLLSIFKDLQKYDEGVEFWQWLCRQSDLYVDSGVFGAAIELLAYQGSVPLESLEELYSYGLKRFPGTFAEYHLSPSAIVSDRAQPTMLPGLPMTLLQGITTARVLARDWRNAYLALDTSLRLWPTQTRHRFFELFIIERPIAEGYACFMLACRSGVVFKPTHLTSLLVQLSKAMDSCNSLKGRITLLEGMVRAMHAYQGVSGRLGEHHIGVFLRACGSVLPRCPFPNNYEGDMAQLRDAMVSIAHTTVGELIRAGMPYNQSMITALTTLAGYINAPQLLDRTVEAIQANHFPMNEMTRGIILMAAGRLRRKNLVEEYWTAIAQAAEFEARPIKPTAWISLARACRRAGHADFFHEQLQTLSHTLTEQTKRMTQSILENRTEDTEDISNPPESLASVPLSELSPQLAAVSASIQRLAQLLKSRELLNFYESPVFMHLDPTRRPLGSEADLRTVYDEMTTDPHLPPPPSPPPTSNEESDGHQPLPPAMSVTGIPFDELRFWNWRTITELMADAQRTQKVFQARMDRAIEKKEALRWSPTAVGFDLADGEGDVPGIEEVRKMVRELRGV